MPGAPDDISCRDETNGDNVSIDEEYSPSDAAKSILLRSVVDTLIKGADVATQAISWNTWLCVPSNGHSHVKHDDLPVISAFDVASVAFGSKSHDTLHKNLVTGNCAH